MISKGRCLCSISALRATVPDSELLVRYLNVRKVPCFIKSPLRDEKRASFGLYSNNDRVYYVDMGTGDRGDIYTLLSKLWSCPLRDVVTRILDDMHGNIMSYRQRKNKNEENVSSLPKNRNTSRVTVQCQMRKWQQHDIEYWKSYGISLEWLEYAEVYPVSHKIITKEGSTYFFKADKYAYCYIERKDSKVSMKIYQPYNTKGFKWSGSHNGSVISLWLKIPRVGKRVCICSSLKDALCVWATTGIPCIALQGEGYTMRHDAVESLRKRYKSIYIAFDGDKPGIEDAQRLKTETGFKVIRCPLIEKAKDWSDIYKRKGKNVMAALFNKALKEAN